MQGAEPLALATVRPMRTLLERPAVKSALIFCTVVLSLSGTAAFGQGAGGATGASGGTLGSSAGAPGTNSAGTAVPSGGGRGSSAATGTGNAATDKADRELDRKIKSICKGC
jgi:hypothetical protein